MTLHLALAVIFAFLAGCAVTDWANWANRERGRNGLLTLFFVVMCAHQAIQAAS